MDDEDDLVNAAKEFKALNLKMAEVVLRTYSEVLKKDEEIKNRKVELLKEREQLIQMLKNWFDLDEIEFKERYSDSKHFFKMYLLGEVERLRFENNCLKLELDSHKIELEIKSIQCYAEDKLKSCLQFKETLNEEMINRQVELIEKNKKGPQVLEENTKEFWAPWIKEFDCLLEKGLKENTALNIIGTRIETEGKWKKSSKKGPDKIITRPNRTTLYRQLVQNRK
jgi:hypothetical protein